MRDNPKPGELWRHFKDKEGSSWYRFEKVTPSFS